MKKPFKYTIFCLKTNNRTETNICPSLHELESWEETDDPNIRYLKQTKNVYLDTRYEAKLRLYNYANFTSKGLSIPKYKPFENTEIGKSIPILNF